ncbi:20996_t:CDS:2 [Gigaspora margarita]|uniref:20996_t:CDS:1 n=1 Tax=Gigaspora margarita TaxID=4874 RepID=A0ABN7UN62_GIGMA|nr:20996_t:CDS:2 [Gigaspora margarita]
MLSIPFPLSETGSLSLFKSPSSMTSRINNDLLGVPSTTDFSSLKNVKRMDVSTAPPSPVNHSISVERRQSDWWKSFLSRIQQIPFLKRNDQKSLKDLSTGENDLSTTSRSSVDVVNCDNNTIIDHDKDLNTTTLLDNDPNMVSSDEKSSFFDVCAQTPRHFSEKPEVLGKVGRFTIIREREDFNTTMFDQCHCQEKPCRFSANGGVHPVLPPETLPDLIPHSSQFYTINESTSPIRIPVYRDSKNLASYKLSCQQYNSSHRHNSWESITPYRPGLSRGSSIYTQNSLYTSQSSAATSRSSLSSLRYSTDFSNANIMNNKTTTTYSSDLASTRGRSKNVINKPIKPPSPVANGRTNEPHTTISSHTGRKFEVEWRPSSSEPASSPSSTMSSSVLCMSSSPNSSIYSTQGASTRSSTLSSKQGRKFEVTIISSDNTE